jgi:serine/threonine protein kinase
MSTVEPGTRLANRFRLEDRVSESDGATLWKAIDEILARPVAVHTFSPEFPRVDEVVTAARAASRLTDPRLTQVFDAADEDGTAYVVSEWVTGESLLDLLSNGPVEPERGAALVAEAAEALAHAHEAGLTHLHLTPSRLVWTAGSTVKVLGLAVDAAIIGVSYDDPALEDAEGLGRLLYAALTGHWPGDEEGGLPQAPLDDGRLCTPRQVTAGVPGYLDVITCRTLMQEARRGQPPLSTPAAVAEALSSVPRPSPVPVSATPPALNLQSEAPDTTDVRPQPLTLTSAAPPPRPSGAVSRVLVTLMVLLVMAAVGIGAWTVGRSLGNKPSTPQSSASAPPSKAPKPVTVKPVSVTGFDPKGDDLSEHPELAPLAVDGKSSTDWHTTNYNSADFGRLKDGVGLILDMGKPIQVSDVVLSLGGKQGSSVQLRVGDSADLSALKTVGEDKDASGTVTITPDKPATGQFVLIWFTRLALNEGKYRGTIYDVMVHSPGSA